MKIIVPPARMKQMPVPDMPAGTSLPLRAIVARYVAVHFGEEDGDGDEWDALAWAIADHSAASLADVMVKLVYALHYLNPGDGRDVPSIDLSAFDADAGRMLMRSVSAIGSRAICTFRRWQLAGWSLI